MIEPQGLTPMPMGSHKPKLSNYRRKRQASYAADGDLSDVAILSMPVDSQSLFQRSSPRCSFGGENKHQNEDVFPELLSQANRELARLLRDVRTESPGIRSDDARSQQVSELLMRAVRCAAKQYQLQAELGALALTDELTGLYNRRGFMALAERQMKLVRRSGRGLMVFVIDVDRLKQINDTLGHKEGDSVLKCTATALAQTFRDSDVVARLGGDEFAVLAIEASGRTEETIRARLFEALKSPGPAECHGEISLSLGFARFEPSARISIGELIAKADQAMYEDKKRRSWPLLVAGPVAQSQ